MYESLVFMHENLGLKYIHQNFIMENSHLTISDIQLFKEQMEKCSDYVYHHKDELYWSMLDRIYTKRKKEGEVIPHIPRCGSGVMPTLDIDGSLYACPRWCPFAIGENTIKVGDVKTLFFDKAKAELIHENAMRDKITKDEKCKTCAFEEQCAFCPAGCYGEFKELKRTTHICPITRVQSEVALNYWRHIDERVNS